MQSNLEVVCCVQRHSLSARSSMKPLDLSKNGEKLKYLGHEMFEVGMSKKVCDLILGLISSL